MDNLVVHHFLFQHNCFIETWTLKMCFPGILSELENWNKTNEQTNKQTSKHVKYYLALNFKFSLTFHVTYSFLYYLSMFFCVFVFVYLPFIFPNDGTGNKIIMVTTRETNSYINSEQSQVFLLYRHPWTKFWFEIFQNVKVTPAWLRQPLLKSLLHTEEAVMAAIERTFYCLYVCLQKF